VPLTGRLATREDVPALMPLVATAIEHLRQGFLDEAQIQSSRAILGVDLALIDDKTYYVAEVDGDLAGCGGWTRRGDGAALDPATDAARVRAMYTHPAYDRRGIGRFLLSLCEAGARDEGFTRVELLATMAGRSYYLSVGFREVEDVTDTSAGVAVQLVRMTKAL
jgi:N-acetylglutamate synthase-like GNAT family acetyltransferase